MKKILGYGLIFLGALSIFAFLTDQSGYSKGGPIFLNILLIIGGYLLIRSANLKKRH